MSSFLSEALSAVSDVEWDEVPVGLEEFVTGEEYLNIKPLSEHQYDLVANSTQIYKKETLYSLYGPVEGERRWKETNNEVIMMLGKGCHASYTPVFNPESGKWEALDSFASDGKVVDTLGNVSYATEAFPEGYGKMVRVKTALGFEEDVYVEHKYLSYTKSKFYHRYRGHGPVFEKIENLNVGDRIAIAVGFDVESPVNIPLEHAELIGYWLGDGTLPTDNYPTINMDFCADETESIQRYKELCELIGDRPYEFKHKTKNMYIFRHGSGSKAVALAKEYGLWGMRSKTKRVPDAVWASDNTRISATVSKLWQTDGCIYHKNGVTAEFVSVSSQLAIDVQRMLLRLGVPSSIRFRTPKSNFSNASRAGYVTVTSDECIAVFADVIDLLDHKRIQYVPKTGRVYQRLDGRRYYDRIVSIAQIEDDFFWTRTVPEAEGYVGNGMISANSGKDHCSTIACAYVVYLLLCLRDPSGYYGYEANEPIDLVNIAINAEQAKNVFFKRFVERIRKSPWFYNKWKSGTNTIEFDKNITLYSGHSEREAFEGLNLIFAVLDEISGFALESTTGNQQANTAHATYLTYKESITSRYPDFGKVVLLSWPRFPGDYIQQRYGGYDDKDKGIVGAIADNGKAKEVIIRRHTFKINEDLPDGIDGNEFTIEWEEDHILRYSRNKVYALRRPSWEMNPLRKIEDYKDSFLTNMADALMRFACMPTGVGDFTFIKNKQAIYNTFIAQNQVDNEGFFSKNFVPKPDVEYFIHVDLSKVHDRCAVALAHVDKWIVHEFDRFGDSYPVVRVDAIRWWKPSKENPMNYAEVIGYILSLKRRGFNIKLVTFDRWNSHDTMNTLINNGIETDMLSVDTPHYDDLLSIMYDERLIGPNIPELTEELSELLKFERGTKVVIDHPRKGYKDLSDAMTGAVYNAITHTVRPQNREVEISSYRGLQKKQCLEEQKQARDSGVIEPPRKKVEMPDEFKDNFDRIITDVIRII